jgi:tellurite methyltransferase
MLRRCVGFHADEVSDWVAELDCRHGQHVRHDPPFQERPWVLTDAGRAERIGSAFECPSCDRAELPDVLTFARRAGPFDEHTLPPGLRREHRVAARTWGVLRVLDGALTFGMGGVERRMTAGDEQPIPPDVPHLLTIDGDVRLQVDFYV